MTQRSKPATAVTALLVALASVLPHQSVTAQNAPRTLDIGGPPGDSTVKRCYTDSILTAALAGFNSPTAVKAFGGQASIPQTLVVDGGYGVFRGRLRIDGTVHGDVIVLNGDARITRTGVVGGTVTVLGGHLTIDPGAAVSGRTVECDQDVAVAQLSDGTLALRPRARPLGSYYTSAFAFDAGPVRITPYLGVGQYNRVEGLPPRGGVSAMMHATPSDSVHVRGYGILRTARDPGGSRPPAGWHVEGTVTHEGALHVTLGAEGGSSVQATVDRPFTEVESGLSALLFRRDYYDWYLRRGGSVFGSLHLTTDIAASASFAMVRETTLPAVDAFSVLRGTEPWRPNPLIDDGRYRILSTRVTWDARDPIRHPVLAWYGHAEVRRVSSNNLTPDASIPTSIRDALPTTDYGATEGDFDLRAYLRLDPRQLLKARLSAAGYLAGDPLTIQSRRAIGGADPLSGYEFRAINCDRRRKVDPAHPALCDREMAIQVEYHRVLPIDLSTRIGSYNIGIRRPDLVLFGDAGSAWLAGDSAGRVPSNRIQALREWKSDVGIGITTGAIGLYLSKSLVDSRSPRVLLLLNPRF